MFHPKMTMFLFKTLVPRSEIDRMFGLCSNVRGLPTQVDNILWGLNSVKSRMDTVEDHLLALKREGGLGGPGGGSGGQSATTKRKTNQKRKRDVSITAGWNNLGKSHEGVWTQLEGY